LRNSYASLVKALSTVNWGTTPEQQHTNHENSIINYKNNNIQLPFLFYGNTKKIITEREMIRVARPGQRETAN
jgi:hypothetical protein